MTRHQVTLVLPFAPDERQAHDDAIAAAGALAGAGGGALDVIQFLPPGAAVPARVGDAQTRWWQAVHPLADVGAGPETLADLVLRALASAPLAAASRRLLLLPAAPLAEHAAALVASALQGASLGRCQRLALDADGVAATRLAFGGRLAVAVHSQADICCATWRADPAGAALQPMPQAQVAELPLQGAVAPTLQGEVLPSADLSARLEGAQLVISGGRGINGPDGFALLARLAQQVDGAVGGSLPAVDAGWVPVARQVGVSGKFVTPRTYLAVAISGTPQHLAGIAGSTRIVAVNNDPEAPIFNAAEVGAVADWRELLPLVARHLETQ